eukprot:UN26824
MDGDKIELFLNSNNMIGEKVNGKMQLSSIKDFKILYGEKYKDTSGHGILPENDRNQLIQKITDLFACSYSRLQKLENEIPKTKAEWRTLFDSLSEDQVKQLKSYKGDISAILKKEKLNLVYTTWSDVSRSFGSSFGSNITDMQFFAVVPSVWRPSDRS